MSDTNGFQFFVMIGGPFWCGLLLCSLGDWIYRAFTRWRRRNWWRTHQTPVEEKLGFSKITGSCFIPPPKIMKKIMKKELKKMWEENNCFSRTPTNIEKLGEN